MAGVTPMVARKGNGNGERSALATAIMKAREARTAVDRHREAVGRAEELVVAAADRLAAATTALEDTRRRHADALVDSASTRKAPAANGAMKAARMGLADAGDELEAAETALTQLKKGSFGEVEQAAAQAENAILVEIARAVAPVGEGLLARAKRLKAELLLVLQTLYVLTDEQTAPPLFSSEIARLNAADARRTPVAELRDQALKLSLEAAPGDWTRAKESAEPWRKWRDALRADPDAPLPEA